MTYYERNKKKILDYQREYQKAKWASDPKHMRAIKIKCVYGLSREEYEALVTKHNGKCAICMQSAKLHIDHDHQTHKVRGLLCQKCNKAIGLFKEDLIAIENAAAYLKASR